MPLNRYWITSFIWVWQWNCFFNIQQTWIHTRPFIHFEGLVNSGLFVTEAWLGLLFFSLRTTWLAGRFFDLWTPCYWIENESHLLFGRLKPEVFGELNSWGLLSVVLEKGWWLKLVDLHSRWEPRITECDIQHHQRRSMKPFSFRH